MLHLSSARPSRVVAVDSLTICPETSVAEELGCCRAIKRTLLVFRGPFLFGFWGCPDSIYDADRADSFTTRWHVPNNDGDLLVIWGNLSHRDCCVCVAHWGWRGLLIVAALPLRDPAPPPIHILVLL